MSATALAASRWMSVDRRRAAAGLRASSVVIGTRFVLWIGIQLLIAGLILLGGAGSLGTAVNSAAGWWMLYGSLIDVATLAGIFLVLRGSGAGYRDLLGPGSGGWQVAVAAVAVIVVTMPAVYFSTELTMAMFDTDTPPMFSLVHVAGLATVFSAVVGPILAELAEPVVYLAIALPALERRVGTAWLAAPIVVGVWAAEHAFYPVLLAGGAVDATFAAYRALSVVPFLATWTAMYYALGRRLLPLMIARWAFNGGTAIAIALGST